ncbi:MAG: transposase [Bacillota bacterium]
MKTKKNEESQTRTEKNSIPREKKYEEQGKKFKGRNSYSKTDEDTTFMRMKEGHMRNGQLKAGYNIQMGTENQFVLGFSIHQRAGDAGCLKPHLEKLRDWLGEYPEVLIADAGYGSKENYAYLKEKQIAACVKYNTFHYKQKKRVKKKRKYQAENFTYKADEDQYICPQRRKLVYKDTRKYSSENGYESSRRIYECESCLDCPVKEDCTKSKFNRQVQVGVQLLQMKKVAHDFLLSPRGRELRSQRPIEVEAVFGRLKHDWGFRRFFLKGCEKVNTEWGILCIAHNIAKAASFFIIGY